VLECLAINVSGTWKVATTEKETLSSARAIGNRWPAKPPEKPTKKKLEPYKLKKTLALGKCSMQRSLMQMKQS
jgi:hypothetical protein